MKTNKLYDLQELDLKLDALVTNLHQIREQLADESQIKTARSTLEEVSGKLKELRIEGRGIELDVKELTERVNNLQSRLYSGVVKNPREVLAVEEELEFTTNEQKTKENLLLQNMVESEDKENDQATFELTLEKLEETRPAELQRLKTSSNQIEVDIVKVTKKRNEIVASVRFDLVALYDALRKSKEGRAVSKVERGMCTACRLTLSQSELQRAKIFDGAVQCGSCNRILVLG